MLGSGGRVGKLLTLEFKKIFYHFSLFAKYCTLGCSLGSGCSAFEEGLDGWIPANGLNCNFLFVLFRMR